MKHLLPLIMTLSAAPAVAQPTLLATVGMIADPARQVGGECVAVEPLMRAGIDPHLYQASAGDVRRLFDADAVLYAGYNLEGQLGDVLGKLSDRKPVVAVSEAAAAVDSLILPDGASYPDPHLWMDAVIWAGTTPAIAELIGDLDPNCRVEALENAEAYADQLISLDAWIRKSVETIPEEQRVLLTAHDAFAYFGRAYDIEVLGIQGVSTESEPGIADIRAIADLVVSRKIPAIFVESTINPRTVESVIAAARSQGHEVTLGGELYSDAMGEQGTAAGTYIGMLHANTTAIVTALGGTTAPLPDALRPWAERWQVEG